MAEASGFEHPVEEHAQLLDEFEIDFEMNQSEEQLEARFEDLRKRRDEDHWEMERLKLEVKILELYAIQFY